MTDRAALMEMFRDLRGHESRLRRPPPAGDGAVFLAEGVRLVERTQAAGHVPKALMVNTEYTKAPPDLGCPVVHLTPHEIQSLTGFGAVRDLLAMFHRPPDPDPATVIPAAQRVLVLEGVANPSNVGTIIRSAAALGVDATLIGPGSGDPLGRRALRTSMGAALDHPWAISDDPLATCREHGFATLALTPAPDALPLPHALAGMNGTRVALFLGAEGPGLDDATLQGADIRVTIPMAGSVDSLNVAAAAAIACHLLASGRE
ncbi:MAG: RNA methyltransferase [Actinobacteria bacterium]|nr:RNA methyltransferase [Actinomycetota bacterium]